MGLLRCMLQQLVEEFWEIKIPVTLTAVLKYYFGCLFESQICSRFFFSRDSISDEASCVVEKLIRFEKVPVPISQYSRGLESPETKAIRLLMRFPVLVDSNGHLDFATPMHRRFCFRLAFPSHIASLEPGITIDEWIVNVLRTFEYQKLADLSSAGSDNFPKEGMLQHQFWRGASMCLPVQYRVAAEVSQIVEKGVVISGMKYSLLFILFDYEFLCVFFIFR